MSRMRRPLGGQQRRRSLLLRQSPHAHVWAFLPSFVRSSSDLAHSVCTMACAQFAPPGGFSSLFRIHVHRPRRMVGLHVCMHARPSKRLLLLLLLLLLLPFEVAVF